jgi:archaeosortase A (PGF-CTERM-specific)
MSDYLIGGAFIAFMVFLLAGRGKKYAAIAGWTFIVLSLMLDVPEYLTLDNLLYPALAVLSVPFLAITILKLLEENPIVLQLSTAAAVTTLLFVPFAFVPVLNDALIATVVSPAAWLLALFGHPVHIENGNILMQAPYASEIILGCTGITAIAILLGSAWGSKELSMKQGILVFLVVVPVIYILNLLRVVVYSSPGRTSGSRFFRILQRMQNSAPGTRVSSGPTMSLPKSCRLSC